MIQKYKRLALIELLRSHLQAAQAKRHEFTSPHGWWRHEMEKMLDHVNWYRAMYDKDPLPMKTLLRMESCASGHVDYSHKLALYCTDLVLEQP